MLPEKHPPIRGKTAILLTNLGTPAAPTPRAIRRYLAEFLSDQRVVDLPRPLWRLILHGIILRIRPRKSAKLYKKIWTREGSPLLTITTLLAQQLQRHLHTQFDDNIIVVFAMRYAQPSISSVLAQLQQQQVQRILLFPLYPQYSATTTASTFDAFAKALRLHRWLPEIRMVNHYADHPAYIDCLANHIRLQMQDKSNHYFVFSFHGLPKRSLQKGDPYYCFCHKTARLIAEHLNLNPTQWQVCFQSRLGRAEWLQPYTEEVMKSLPQQGQKNISVICPGFSADCLETLEEINIRNRETFLQAGGESFHYIPALNADKAHIKALADIATSHCQGWI